MKFYANLSVARPGYYYISNHDSSNPNAELCDNGNIKIIIDSCDETCVSQEDLDLFYIKLETIIVRYIPVTFNGRLL